MNFEFGILNFGKMAFILFIQTSTFNIQNSNFFPLPGCRPLS